MALLLVLAGVAAPGPAMAQESATQTAVAAETAAADTAAAPIEPTVAVETAVAGARSTIEAAGLQVEEPPPPPTNDPTAIELNATMAFLIVLALLGLLVYVLWRLFDYLRESRDGYYRTVSEFAHKGVFFSPVLVGTTAPSRGGLEGAGDVVPATFALTGPGAMTTGQKAVFTALLNGSDDPSATWQVEPPPGAGLEDAGATLSGSGASVTVEAPRQGAFVLVASHPGEPVLSVRTQVTVVEPPDEGGGFPNLPFIGQGYGSLVGAVVLIAALVVLATTRAVDADVVGVILGALAGYLFGVGINQGKG